MKQVCKRMLALLLGLLLLGSTLTMASAAVDAAVEDSCTLDMAMKFFRLDAEGTWVETTRAKPGEALLLRFYAATNFATNGFDLGFAFDRQFFINSLASGGIDAVFSVNPALPMLEDYMFTYVTEDAKASNAKLKRLVADGRLTQAALAANDYLIGSVEWSVDAVNTALPADTWIFEMDSFSVADNDYVRTPEQTGVLEVPAALGLDASAGLDGLYSFSKGEPGAAATENVLPGNGWTPSVTSAPAEISVYSKLVLDANGGAFGDQPTSVLTGVIGEKVTGLVDMDGLPTCAGCQFAGFARTPEGTALTDAELAALTYDYEDQTLYALWTPAPYVYTYDAADGAFADGTKKREVYWQEGATPEPLDETPALPGCRFLDWDNELPATAQSDLTFTALYEPLPCEVCFLAADGSEIDTVTVDGGTQLDVLDLPEGYKPDGWTDGEGNAVTFPYPITGDLTLVAPENGNIYNAYFYVNDELYATTQAAYEEQINVPEDPKVEGYTFLMWDPDPDGIQDTEELRFDAVLEQNAYQFTADFNGGLADGAALYSASVFYGDPLPALQPEREGFVFAGWLNGEELLQAIPETMPAGDLTLTAQWTPIGRTVYYYYNNAPAGVTDPPPAEGLQFGDEIPLPAHPDVPGYTVADWVLMDDDGPLSEAVVGLSDVYATADWTAIPYQVTYVYSGEIPAGAQAPAAVTAHIGDEITLPEITAPSGYVFEGWTVSGDAEGKVGAQDVTVTGKWSRETFRVMYAFEGQIPELDTWPEDYYAHTGDPVVLPEMTAPEGYTFEGWTLENDVDGKVGTQPVTVVGSWRIHTHTATFLDKDGGTVSAELYAYGASVPAPQAPAVIGLRFTDWYSETAGVWTETTVMGDADVTYTARYAEHSYTVTYLANGETAATQTVPAGAETGAPAYTAPEGYGLRAWTDAAGETVVFPFTPADDTTLTAVLDRAVNGVFYREKGPDEIEITGLEFGRTSAEIPAKIKGKPVTAIADGAFQDNAGLTSVTIPKGVAQIGANVFAGCTALTQADYAGTQADFEAVTLGGGNDPLLAVLRCHVHDYTETVLREATCKQTGLRQLTCSSCGDSYTEEIPLAEHTHGYWVLDLDRSVKEEICTVCGQVLASEPYEEPPVVSEPPTVKIVNNPGTTQLPYRYTLVLTAEAANLDAGQAIAWYLDDVLLNMETVGETTSRIRLEELRAGVTVTVRVVDAVTGVPVVDKEGNEVADWETVEVNNGFFARLIGFFRALFRRLRIVEQVFRF